MNNISGFLRLWDIIGSKQKKITPIIPISRSNFLDGVKAGKFPQPVKVGRSTLWRKKDIESFINNLGKEPEEKKKSNEKNTKKRTISELINTAKKESTEITIQELKQLRDYDIKGTKLHYKHLEGIFLIPENEDVEYGITIDHYNTQYIIGEWPNLRMNSFKNILKEMFNTKVD